MKAFWKNSKVRYLFLCILITFVVSCIIGITPISLEECKCDIQDSPSKLIRQVQRTNQIKSGKHRLAILVPFRDRFDELLIFVPHMHKFLSKQNIRYHIFIVNQIDNYRFNRASLINAGFLEVQKDFDYIAMHDVDLLPMNDELLYHYPAQGPYHIASPELHPRYHYPTFVGGILLVNSSRNFPSREQFVQVNGMSNKYWGWGLEDDEFYVRLKEAGLNVGRPENVSTGTHNTFKHIHDRNRKKRDMTKCYNQREVTRRRDRRTGLKDVSYELVDVTELTIAGTPTITVFKVSLHCNKTDTPWCDCTKSDDMKGENVEEKKKNKKSQHGS
ncbi:beta-1,4-galactosyltransferase 7 isoform X1 [Neodiprion virginianus]|uniref:beta-1,4-galactosyltransferase 7 isoform X1 n=1 Tax=Neodiprion virginianus TaxID=2961670 RepID=UPI001EE768A6|nr:beta-1,4-galactosyltransferase 7 isoform X1 [Neodiprion virginianus]